MKAQAARLVAILCCAGLLKYVVNNIAEKAAGYKSFPQSVYSSARQFSRRFYTHSRASQDDLIQIAQATSPELIFHGGHVHLSGQNRVINELTISHPGNLHNTGTRSVVLLHGFGAGLGFFYANLEIVARSFEQGTPIKIFAIDWLGMGLSSRPSFVVPATLTEEDQRIWVENYFVDQLAEYFQIRALEQVTIIAHSFGGYLAVRFAECHPNAVNNLILISPVAVNDNPYEASSKSDLVKHPPYTGLTSEFSAGSRSATVNPLPSFIVYLWNKRYTPFDFVRYATFLGPKLTSAWTYTLRLPENDLFDAKEARNRLHSYTYRVFSEKASSERALSYVLIAGAHAKEALMRRLPIHIPVALIYGENDWMPIKAGHSAAKICNSKGGAALVFEVAGTGHHSYMENHTVVNQIILDLI